ncbi:MAG: 1-acyl-sn-glycerol-3-phosphate acyltransferase [Candidatus Deianiraeaceae bacterium]|jgi:1-acyl-sn-glycerol-3-phosphate acyltransferase
MNYIRTALFNIIILSVTIVMSIVTFIIINILMYGLFFIPLFAHKYSKKIAIKAVIIWSVIFLFLLKYITNIKFVVHNAKIIQKKGVIIACNHCSAWETFFFNFQCNVPAFILKKSLLQIPIIGFFGKSIGMIGIDRKSYTKKCRDEIINKANSELKNGRNIIIFPQGTRVPTLETFNRQKYPYKPGITIFARGHYVVTASTNARVYFGKSLFSLKKSGTIHVIFNECFYINEHLSKNDIMDKISYSIDRGCKQILQI